MKNKRYRFPLGYSMKNAVLDLLLNLGESITLFDSPYTSMKRAWRRERGIPEPTQWRYNRAIKYLEAMEQIKILKKNDNLFIKLTKKGKINALLLRLNENYKKTQKWDGKWRLIIWDIPEASSKERDRIRYFLKSLGFYKLQFSVFVTPYPLPESAVEYLKTSGLIEFLRFLRVDKIDDDKTLRHHFDLNQN